MGLGEAMRGEAEQTETSRLRSALVQPMFEALVEYSGRRKWYGHDLACALIGAMLDAVPEGWAKVDGRWQHFVPPVQNDGPTDVG